MNADRRAGQVEIFAQRIFQVAQIGARDRLRPGVGYSVLLSPDALKRGFNKVDVYLVGRGGRALQKLYSGAGPIEGASGP